MQQLELFNSSNAATHVSPPYKLRISKRARSPRLTLCPMNGLEVVIPNHIVSFNIHAFIQEKSGWLNQHMSILQQALKYQQQKNQFPRTIHLRALHSVWHVVYIKTNSQQTRLIQDEACCTLKIQAKNFNINIIKNKLQCWLHTQAETYLAAWMQQLSKQTDLQYQQLKFRNQNTLWGSCSRDKKISLNKRLLFLPKHLAKHVMLHELCHLRYLSHGVRFWQLLAKFDPDWKKHNHTLKTAEQLVPIWVKSR